MTQTDSPSAWSILDRMARLVASYPEMGVEHKIANALGNLEGCVGKLEDAVEDRYAMTYERAVRDSLEPLRYYTRQLRELLLEEEREEVSG